MVISMAIKGAAKQRTNHCTYFIKLCKTLVPEIMLYCYHTDIPLLPCFRTQSLFETVQLLNPCLTRRETVHMYAYVYVCVYVCMCVCVHVYVCMCVCVYVCMCAYVHVCMCACVHMCMCACVHVVEAIK